MFLRKLNGTVYLGNGCDLYLQDGVIASIEPGSFSYSVWNETRFVPQTVQRRLRPAALFAEPLEVLPFSPKYYTCLLYTSRCV